MRQVRVPIPATIVRCGVVIDASQRRATSVRQASCAAVRCRQSVTTSYVALSGVYATVGLSACVRCRGSGKRLSSNVRGGLLPTVRRLAASVLDVVKIRGKPRRDRAAALTLPPLGAQGSFIVADPCARASTPPWSSARPPASDTRATRRVAPRRTDGPPSRADATRARTKRPPCGSRPLSGRGRVRRSVAAACHLEVAEAPASSSVQNVRRGT